MQETNGSGTRSPQKSDKPDVHLVVEVDGHPIGFLDLDMERLWPLISHNSREACPLKWIDRHEFEKSLRAAVGRRLLVRLEHHLFKALGDEIVRAELDIESIMLKAEAAANAFGRTKEEVDKVVAAAGRTDQEFNAFLWDYLLEDKDVPDLKKAWKAAGRE